MAIPVRLVWVDMITTDTSTHLHLLFLSLFLSGHAPGSIHLLLALDHLVVSLSSVVTRVLVDLGLLSKHN